MNQVEDPKLEERAETAEPEVPGPEPAKVEIAVRDPAIPKTSLEVDDVFLQDFKHPETQQILLPAQSVLTETYIRKILQMVLAAAALECLKPPPDHRLEAIELSRGLPFDYALYLEGKRVVEDLYECAKPHILPEQREHVWTRATRRVGRQVDQLLQRDLDLYTDFRIYDAYRHSHPINTAILAILIGQAARVAKARLVELGLSGLMADIGKARVPFAILNKPGKLDQAELAEARAHVGHSKAVVELFRWAAGDILNVAFHHHERYDGSGYPKQQQGRQIGEFARMVGLADAFDAMVADVVYRPRMEAAVVYRLLTTSSAFDPAVIEAFKKRVTPYPRGLQVKPNNGQEGVVSKVQPDNPFRPVLIVEDFLVDLASDSSLRITGQHVPRRCHRTSVMLPVRVRSAGGNEMSGMAINISLAGLCVESESIPVQGDTLTVTLPVLGRDEHVSLTAFLAWVRHGEGERTTYGLSITPNSAEDRELLVDLILGLP
ncbi:MAG: PilZ domain-containing protein [Candidatus Sericytochromatia bacterium]|uniref:PilZ domain-containing protein n=1 Tax=Candidatus Tanganyikabacteria bacterium TaxID=2961651 RepID=A0A938BL62_9BACT|nr:PilZ domain-containing protein [Candidatus Tanganyikabacteria bacterium]